MDYQVSGYLVSHHEKKISKASCKNGEDYNRGEMRHIYIDCHSLLHQYLSLSIINSALLQDLKKRKNIKEKKKKSLKLIQRRETLILIIQPHSGSLQGYIYRQKKILEDKTRPHVKNRRMASLMGRGSARILANLRQNQGLRSLVLVHYFVWS